MPTNSILRWEGDTPVLEDTDLTAALTRLAVVGSVVPQTHIAAPSAPAAVTSAAPAALTSAQSATANAAAQTGSYVQADVQTIATLANALKTAYNAAQADLVTNRTERTAVQADVVALRAEVAALTTLVTTLLTELQTAGVLASS